MKIKAVIRNFIDICLASFWIKCFMHKKEVKADAKKILLVFPYGIGNTILANGSLKSIKKAYPDSQLIAVYMQEPTKEILEILGGFDKLLCFDLKSHLREKIKFIKLLKSDKIDIAINFFAQSYYFFNLILLCAKIPVRIGFHLPKAFGGIRSAFFLSHFIKYDSTISEFKNNLNLIKLLRIPLENSLSFRLKRYAIVKTSEDRLRVGIHTGRLNPGKPGWPIDRFSELMLLLIREYNAEVFIFGGKEEKGSFDDFDSKYGNNIINLIGKTNLEETIDYIHSMDIFISNDTGLMHLSASQGVPLVAIFGPTDVVKNRPIVEDQEKLRIISKKYKCSPCYPIASQKNCNGRKDCLYEISSNEVLVKALEII